MRTNGLSLNHNATNAAPTLNCSLVEEPSIRAYTERRDAYFTNALRTACSMSEALGKAVTETGFLSQLNLEQTRSVVPFMKAIEFMALVTSTDEAKKAAEERALRTPGSIISCFEGLSVAAEAFGEKIYELGRTHLNHEFRSSDPETILSIELPSYIMKAIDSSQDQATKLDALRREHEKKFKSPFRIQSSPHERLKKLKASPVHLLPDGDLDKVEIMVEVESQKKSAKGHSRTHSHHRKGNQTGFPQKEDSVADMYGELKRVRKEALSALQDFGPRLGRQIIGSVISPLRPTLTKICQDFLTLSERYQFTTQNKAAVMTLFETRDFLDQVQSGTADDFDRFIRSAPEICQSLEQALLTVAHELSDFVESLSYPDKDASLRALASQRVNQLVESPRIPDRRFLDGNQTPIDKNLLNSIFRYSFAVEQEDTAQMTAHYEVIDSFLRRDIRAALQTIYHEDGLINDEAAAILRSDECGKRREKEAPLGESDEERIAREAEEAQLAAEIAERKELVAAYLSEYFTDADRLLEVAEFILPQTIDRVLTRLEHSLQTPALRDVILHENPELFTFAQEHSTLFDTYAYTALKFTETIMRRYQEGTLDIARYANPETLNQALEQDGQREKRIKSRARFDQILIGRDINPKLAFAIIQIGFATREGGYYTTDTSRTKTESVFARLERTIINFSELKDALQAAYDKMLKEKIISGPAPVALNLRRDTKKGPALALRDFVAFAKDEPTITERVQLDLENDTKSEG